MSDAPNRRSSDLPRAPLWDRIKWRAKRARATAREWSNAILLVVLVLAVVAAAVSVLQARGASAGATRAAEDAAQSARTQQRADARAVERDAARTFQRCEQIEPLAIVEQLALERAPTLRAQIQRERPGLLDEEGRLPVPDCKRIYPLGAAVSHLYPDLTPTKPAP